MADPYEVTARYYDPAYTRLRDRSGDIEFYRTLARECGGPLLELGCGTGRVLLPIARDGVECTGLDASPAMLEALAGKAPPPTLRTVVADMHDFHRGERFALVFAAFRGFQHLYTVDEQLSCLRCVSEHLRPGAPFAFDVFSPSYERLARADGSEIEDVRFEVGGEEVVRTVALRHEAQSQSLRVRMRYRRAGGEEVEELRLRYFFRYELEHLLVRAGFGNLTFYGGFDRRPFDHVSGETIVIAKR